MPIAYQFDTAACMLEVIATGHITVADRVTFVSAASLDRCLPMTTPILIDATGILNAPSVDDVPKMARLVELLAARFRSRIAYYVTGVGIVTPYMLAAHTVRKELADAKAFTNRDEAVEWLRSC